MTSTHPRKFWEYRELDGTTTNLRVAFLAASVLVAAALAAIPAFIGGIAEYWPLIPCGALVGALGATIAHAIDYVNDRKEGSR